MIFFLLLLFALPAFADRDASGTSWQPDASAQKLGRDLVLPGDPEGAYDVFQGTVGFVHRFTGGEIVPLMGAPVDVGLVPSSVEAHYGTRFPAGLFIFLGLQPARMSDM